MSGDAKPVRRERTWLFGPWTDLLFVANVFWPLLLLGMLWGGLDARDNIRFWQVYFVTTPHRWVTLALVFCDGARFRERSGAFLGVAAVVALFCLGVRTMTGTLTCLLAIDYAWNAWHFAAQHHGIFRIYGRMSQPERTGGMTLEKAAMRVFVLYVAFRVISSSWWTADVQTWFQTADFALLALPGWLLVREMTAFDRRAVGRMAYLVSWGVLYSGFLMSIRYSQPALVLMFATASALFHAVEYMSVVSWSVDSRHKKQTDRATLFSRLLPRWGLVLLVFMSIIGMGAWLWRHHWMQTFLLINVIVAFLHYSYDGMIWKSRKSKAKTAAG